jgi:hypothetical protein
VTSHGPSLGESKSETKLASVRQQVGAVVGDNPMGMKCLDVNGIKQLVDMRHPYFLWLVSE